MLSFINSLAQVTLYSTIVILSVLLVRRLFAKRLNIIFLSILWIIVLARLILPVTINSPINLDTLKSIKGDTEVQSDSTIENSSNDYAYVGENTIDDIPSGAPAFANSDFVTQTYTTEFEETQFQNDKPSFIESLKTLLNSIFKNKMFLSIIFVIWLFGAWVSLLRNFFAIYDFNRKVKQCRKITNIEILNSLMKGKRILSIDKSVVICECNFIDTPVTYGLRSPKILIPKDYYSSININKMQMVLLHELSHVKNKDILKNYIWLIARIVYWYNPIVTIAYNKYLEDIEYISDNAVIKNTSSQNLVDYIQSLLDSLEFSSKYMKVPCAISFCKSKSTLRKRVEIMLKPKKTSKVIETVTALICIMLCIVCFTTACIGKTV